jgi:hypothetical protein
VGDRVGAHTVEFNDDMSDAHVEWLEYELTTSWLFDTPPPLLWRTPVFKANLSNSLLRVEMLAHFATEEQARTAVEPFLQSWEIDVALTYGKREVKFAFKQVHLVDRNPPPGSPVTATATGTVRAWGCATAHVTMGTYPPAPINFSADPDVVSLWTRFEGFKNGREPLASMAYFCYTLLTYRHRNVDDASKSLGVDKAVLKKLSELGTNRGDLTTARKMTLALRPFTSGEAAWLDGAIRALIRRVGEIASGSSPLQLTMDQLPRL